MRVGRGRAIVTWGAVVGLLAIVSACSNSSDDTGTSATAATSGNGSASDGESGSGGDDCSAFEQYGDLSGQSVEVYTSIVDVEGEEQQASYKKFEECTGATIEYNGTREFEAQLPVRVKAGDAPDIAYVPQPGLIKTLVDDTGAPVAASQAVQDNVDTYWSPAWKGYGTVDGTFYAAPLGANAKSFVWYSPKAFKDAGYEVPTTWDELLALSDKIVADGEAKPWCAGIESGDATGWPATDWLEDMVLRTAGPDVYDQWVDHTIAFNDPQIVESLDNMGKILRNTDYVNAGWGDVKSIASTPWSEAGQPIQTGECYMMRAASFYQGYWDEDTKIAEDGDVYAFYLPSMDDTQPVEGGGEFVLAFNDDPATVAFQTYLSTPDWANEKARTTNNGGWVTANTGLDPSLLKTDFDRLAYSMVSSPEFRFDGSDLMPGEVGAGSFWSAMVDYVTTDKSSTDILTEVENSWPTPPCPGTGGVARPGQCGHGY